MKPYDFSAWLEAWGEPGARGRERLARIDPAFGSLADLQTKVVNALEIYLEPSP